MYIIYTLTSYFIHSLASLRKCDKSYKISMYNNIVIHYNNKSDETDVLVVGDRNVRLSFKIN